MTYTEGLRTLLLRAVKGEQDQLAEEELAGVEYIGETERLTRLARAAIDLPIGSELPEDHSDFADREEGLAPAESVALALDYYFGMSHAELLAEEEATDA